MSGVFYINFAKVKKKRSMEYVLAKISTLTFFTLKITEQYRKLHDPAPNNRKTPANLAISRQQCKILNRTFFH